MMMLIMVSICIGSMSSHAMGVGQDPRGGSNPYRLHSPSYSPTWLVCDDSHRVCEVEEPSNLLSLNCTFRSQTIRKDSPSRLGGGPSLTEPCASRFCDLLGLAHPLLVTCGCDSKRSTPKCAIAATTECCCVAKFPRCGDFRSLHTDNAHFGSVRPTDCPSVC